MVLCWYCKFAFFHLHKLKLINFLVNQANYCQFYENITHFNLFCLNYGHFLHQLHLYEWKVLLLLSFGFRWIQYWVILFLVVTRHKYFWSLFGIVNFDLSHFILFDIVLSWTVTSKILFGVVWANKMKSLKSRENKTCLLWL